jgi:hypothetical protein
VIRTMCLFILAMVVAVPSLCAQSFDGEVTGTISGGVHKYSGEFTDDLWGPAGFVSIQYTPTARLILEGRFGLGEYRWKVSPSDMERYPGYFGQGAQYGDFYPGTLTTIEPENESRLTTIDLLVNYVIVHNIPAQPFISAGIGWSSFAPSNSEEHDALPNHGSGVYTGSAVSIPIGAGLRIPFSARVGMMLRGEYRFVFTPWLDDVNFDGGNDAITSLSFGLTYTFNDPPAPMRRVLREEEIYLHEPHRMDGHHGHGHHGDKQGDKADSAEEVEPLPEDSSATLTAPADTTTTTPQPPAKPTVEIKRCPPGLSRLCLDEDHSVCVDTTFVPGRERIEWENGVVYDPSDPGHGKTLKSVAADNPCYAHVIRQTGNSWYHCVDCCFERLKTGSGFIYTLLEERIIAKGEGTFKADDCPDCAKVVAEGR